MSKSRQSPKENRQWAYQLQITRKSTGINPTATIECRDRADLRKQLADNIRGDHGTAHISLRIVGDRGVVYSGTVEGLRGKRLPLAAMALLGGAR